MPELMEVTVKLDKDDRVSRLRGLREKQERKGESDKAIYIERERENCRSPSKNERGFTDEMREGESWSEEHRLGF